MSIRRRGEEVARGEEEECCSGSLHHGSTPEGGGIGYVFQQETSGYHSESHSDIPCGQYG